MVPPKSATKKSAKTTKTGETSQTNDSKVRRITNTDSQLEFHLMFRNIVQAKQNQKPINFAEIKKMLASARSWNSPVTPRALKYQKRMGGIKGEPLIHSAISTILPIDDLETHDFFSCVEKQNWSERIKPYEESPDEYLIPPTSDYTIGMQLGCFPHIAIKAMGGYAVPLQKPNVAFPFLMVEAKSATGSIEEARLQNILSGAIAVNNILQLKKRIGQDFYGQGKVFTVCITPHIVNVRVHWVIRQDDRDQFLDCLCGSWDTEYETEYFAKARQTLLNVLDWLEIVFGPELQHDMEEYEVRLKAEGWTLATVKPPNVELAPVTAQPASAEPSRAKEQFEILSDNEYDPLAR